MTLTTLDRGLTYEDACERLDHHRDLGRTGLTIQLDSFSENTWKVTTGVRPPMPSADDYAREDGFPCVG